MTAPSSSRYKGWYFNEEDSRLEAFFNGNKVFHITASGFFVVAGGLTSSAPTGIGIGYATGAGGAVTQITNKGTGVTLNTLTGTITTDNADMAAAAEVTFIVTNSTVAITDTVVLSIQSGGTSGEYLAHVTDVGAGVFDITIANMTGNTLGDVLLINFAVIMAVAA